MGGPEGDGVEGVLGGTEGRGEEVGASKGDGGKSDGVIFSIMPVPAGFVAILFLELDRFCVKNKRKKIIRTQNTIICRVS